MEANFSFQNSFLCLNNGILELNIECVWTLGVLSMFFIFNVRRKNAIFQIWKITGPCKQCSIVSDKLSFIFQWANNVTVQFLTSWGKCDLPFSKKVDMSNTYIMRKLKSSDCFERQVTLSMSSPVQFGSFISQKILSSFFFFLNFYLEFFWVLPSQDRTLMAAKSPPWGQIQDAEDW